MTMMTIKSSTRVKPDRTFCFKFGPPVRSSMLGMPRFAHPLSPTIFLRRNAGKTLPLIAVISLAVMLVQSIIALINSIPLSIQTIYRYTDRFLGVSPRLDPTLTPVFVKELTTKPPVEIERVILCRGSGAQVKSIVGKWPFAVMGFEKDDLEYYLRREDYTGITGRRPVDGKPEMMVSTPVAKNLHVKIGDISLSPTTRTISLGDQ